MYNTKVTNLAIQLSDELSLAVPGSSSGVTLFETAIYFDLNGYRYSKTSTSTWIPGQARNDVKVSAAGFPFSRE